MEYLPRDIGAGIEAGRFDVSSPVAALILALGTTHGAICAVAMGAELSEDFPEEVAYQVLLGLGMSRLAAKRLVGKPIDAVHFPPASLLARTLHGDDPGDSE
jgi:hypothetical protein